MSNIMRQRQQKIVQHIEKVGIVSLAELAEMFDVSPFTIRRDIDYLAGARLVAKVKGGAQRIETSTHFREASLPSRLQLNLSEKEKIAEKALEFIHPGETIFLDGSSTNTCFARAIARLGIKITVLTNSVLVSLELSESPEVNIVGLGGVLDRETLSFVGFDTQSPAKSYYVEKAFFSCTGFVPEEGTFENAAFNSNTKRLIAERAANIFLLVDSTKIGKRALAQVLNTDQIRTVITDKVTDPSLLECLKKHEVRLVTCEKNENNIDQKSKLNHSI